MHPSNNYGNGTTDTNNVNGPLVLWKLPMYVAAAKVVGCNEKSRASTRRHKIWLRNPYPVENHNCGIRVPNENLPKQLTTCMERVNEWRP
jgi:hypothetical protein